MESFLEVKKNLLEFVILPKQTCTWTPINAGNAYLHTGKMINVKTPAVLALILDSIIDI